MFRNLNTDKEQECKTGEHPPVLTCRRAGEQSCRWSHSRCSSSSYERNKHKWSSSPKLKHTSAVSQVWCDGSQARNENELHHWLTGRRGDAFVHWFTGLLVSTLLWVCLYNDAYFSLIRSIEVVLQTHCLAFICITGERSAAGRTFLLWESE